MSTTTATTRQTSGTGQNASEAEPTPRPRPARSRAERDALVEEHIGLVGHIVRRMARRLPSHVNQDDLISAGYEGLLRAAERFDEERGVAFSTFAGCSVRGSVLDALREMDPLARPTRERVTRLDNARAALRAEYGATIPEDLVAERAGLTEREARDAMTVRHTASLISIDEERAEGPLHSVIEDRGVGDIAGRLLVEEAVDAIRDEMRHLRPNDQRVIAMYYADGLLLREIAAVLGVTEGRVSQIHKRAITTLRTALAGRDVL